MDKCVSRVMPLQAYAVSWRLSDSVDVSTVAGEDLSAPVGEILRTGGGGVKLEVDGVSPGVAVLRLGDFSALLWGVGLRLARGVVVDRPFCRPGENP